MCTNRFPGEFRSSCHLLVQFWSFLVFIKFSGNHLDTLRFKANVVARRLPSEGPDGLLIRWSQVRIPHGLPRYRREAHEFTFVGFFVSGRFGKYPVTAGQRSESRRARVIAAELASLDYTPLPRNDGAEVLTELVALQLPRPSHR